MALSNSTAALGRIVATVLGMGQTRLQLAGVELAQARQAAIALIIWGVVATLTLLVASLFASAVVLVLMWPIAPLATLLALGAAYAALGWWCLGKARAIAHSFPPLLEATSAELGRDKEALQHALNRLAQETTPKAKTDGPEAQP